VDWALSIWERKDKSGREEDVKYYTAVNKQQTTNKQQTNPRLTKLNNVLFLRGGRKMKIKMVLKWYNFTLKHYLETI
jgi:hypothetical protein